MSYIPPHKRYSKDKDSPSPKPTRVPESLKMKGKVICGRNNVYANNAISKWFTVGFDDHSRFSLEVKEGKRAFSLVRCNEGAVEPPIDEPWLFVAENVKQDFILTIERVKCEMEKATVKPSMVARFGRVLFYGNSSICLNNPLGEDNLRQLKHGFNTSIPPPYTEHVENLVVEKLGIVCVQEKERYYVMLNDNLRGYSNLYCKCVVSKDGNKIQLHKIEFYPLRHMVADISCLKHNLDLRLMLRTKATMMALPDDESNEIRDIIGSAILDSQVRGGLRWPFAKDSSEGRYAVVGTWHTTAKSYSNSSIRFKLRNADRFNFKTSTGEVAQEVFLEMPGIISHLRKQTFEANVLWKMLEDNLKLIWEHSLLDY